MKLVSADNLAAEKAPRRNRTADPCAADPANDPSAVADPPVTIPAPPDVLQSLADRIRPGGLFLMMLRNDGSIAWHDAAASAFFQRFVLPVVRSSLTAPDDASPARPLLPAIAAAGGARRLPQGVLLAGVVHLERKQKAGVLLLAARTSDRWLPPGEDVLRAAGECQLDAQWLASEASRLPGYDLPALSQQASLLLAALHDQLRLAVLLAERNNLSEQLANSYEELSLIYQLSGGMRVNRRAGDFFRQTCLDVLEVVNVRGMGAALCAKLSDRPPPAVYGDVELSPSAVAHLSDALIPILNQRKTSLVINDVSQQSEFAWLAPHAARLLAVPMQRQEKVLGCLFALDKLGSDFDSVDSKLLTSIANQAAVYLENALLYEDVHGLMMGLLHSLTSAVDAKDTYTCGHSERVAVLACHLAQEIHLGEPEIEQIYMAALLHDVGKIGVPEGVLQKSGRLTIEEYEQMKKHVRIGAHILADIKQVSPLIPGVLYHHERYDGKGYPDAMAGDRIPLMGRIICVADSFDAMTSTRTYRKALPLEVALCEIRRCSGTHFDPFLAEAFLRSHPDHLRALIRSCPATTRQPAEVEK